MKKAGITKLIPIFIWLVICAGLLVAWIYLYGLIDKKIASINNIKTQAKSAELRLEQRHDLEALADEINIKKQKINSVFLTKDTLINFIEQLEDAGRVTGVALKINSDEPNGNPVFRLAVDGGYNQIFHFLLLLENFPYKVDISSIAVQEQGGAGTTWKANLELTLLSYEAKI